MKVMGLDKMASSFMGSIPVSRNTKKNGKLMVGLEEDEEYKPSSTDDEFSSSSGSDDDDEFHMSRSKFSYVTFKVEITQKIHVDGEVNRARCMPQNSSIVAAKTSSSEVYVFDSSKQILNNSCDPDVRLRGHEK